VQAKLYCWTFVSEPKSVTNSPLPPPPKSKLQKLAINDALPLKAARRDAIAKLTSFWGFEFEPQTNPMSFHLDSPWGATLMSLVRLCILCIISKIIGH